MNSRLTTALSLCMATLSWLGLGYLMYAYPPDILGRILFLSLLFLAVSFTFAPLIGAVHGRLAYGSDQEARPQGVVWREAGMAGLFFGLCAWLRFIRVLTWANALLLAVVFVLTEILLLARD
jgi:hypothetical protein